METLPKKGNGNSEVRAISDFLSANFSSDTALTILLEAWSWLEFTVCSPDDNWRSEEKRNQMSWFNFYRCCHVSLDFVNFDKFLSVHRKLRNVSDSRSPHPFVPIEGRPSFVQLPGQFASSIVKTTAHADTRMSYPRVDFQRPGWTGHERRNGCLRLAAADTIAALDADRNSAVSGESDLQSRRVRSRCSGYSSTSDVGFGERGPSRFDGQPGSIGHDGTGDDERARRSDTAPGQPTAETAVCEIFEIQEGEAERGSNSADSDRSADGGNGVLETESRIRARPARWVVYWENQRLRSFSFFVHNTELACSQLENFGYRLVAFLDKMITSRL